MSHDTLSEVLRSVRLRGAIFYYVSYGPEWAAEVPPSREIATAVMPGAEHVMEYHVLTKGDAWAAVIGQTPVRVTTGDIVIFPHGDGHVMSSAPGLRPTPLDVDWVFSTRNHPKPIPFSVGGVAQADGSHPAPAATNIVCGFFGCDLRPFNPLIATLPRLLHLPAVAHSGGVVAQLLHMAVAESEARRPGSDAVLERISEMLFVESLRRHVERLPEEDTGWLAGLRDRAVGRALALLHETPADDWTIEQLSDRVGLSRSALHERFVHFIGQPPMQYLARWRMQLASKLLLQSNATVAAIAAETGYESEAAFSRAFKRIVGASPAAWRRERVRVP
jgi:AraC-like DNA-binding protein